jgi:membrane-bound lytic murein transglycosylase MltF
MTSSRTILSTFSHAPIGLSRYFEATAPSWPLRSRVSGLIAIIGYISTLLLPAPGSAQSNSGAAWPRQLNVDSKPWKGDFDQMLERRMIRVMLPYSRTFFFNDKGRERGISAEIMRDFESYLNKKYAKEFGKRPLTIYLIPTTFDKLFSGLEAGLGDIAAGNLTVTEERLKRVDFVAPVDRKPVRELIVTGPTSPAIATLDDLSGKTVHVRQATTYYDSLVVLNQRLKAAGKAPLAIVPLPDALADEDKLEMLNAGLFELVVMDDWVARAWAQVLPRIKVREDLVVRSEGHIGWAIRKGSPKLEAALLEFYVNFGKKLGVIEYRMASFHKSIKQITNNTDSDDWKRFEQVLALFRRYGDKYGFDPLMLAAQGYQESRLRQEARSPVGAIGVMQIMPATGRQLGVGDITLVEPNIHGGTKYMDQLISKHFNEAKLSEENRALFAFASYNAGPGNILKLRAEAQKRGLDPDQWFNNVEIVTAERIGIETTTYVRNIYKYYVAYKLMLDTQEKERNAREQATSSTR